MRKVVVALIAMFALVGVGVSGAVAADSTSAKESSSASGCTKLVYKFKNNAAVTDADYNKKFTAYQGNKFVYTKGDGAVNGSYLGDVYTSDWNYRGYGWVWKGHLDYLYCT